MHVREIDTAICLSILRLHIIVRGNSMLRRTVIALAAAGLLAACATGATLDARPLDSGTSMDFAAPAPRVAEAAKQTLLALSLGANNVRDQGGSTVISFQKGMTAWSWGEVGRVVVTPVTDASSRVFIDTEKVSQMQITGTNEDEFSRDIFSGIRERLAH